MELMRLMVQLQGGKRGVEVGTFTGYSALCFAEALPEDGKLTCLDVSKEFTDLAREHWKKAGLDHKIDLILGPAVETLDKLLAEEGEGSFDFAYIDADKPNYSAYYERIIKLLRKGGFVAIDNILWSGRILNEESKLGPNEIALREIVKTV